MVGRIFGLLIVSALVFAVAVFAWRWGEEFWYGRYPVEDGYAAYWAADHRRAHPILRAYAKQGDPRAQTYFGLQYEDGKGTFRSERLAASWMRRAADQDYPDALVLLGAYYLDGVGIDEDWRGARPYFQRAVDIGHPEGNAGLASLDFQRGLEDLPGGGPGRVRRFACQGNSLA